MQVNLMRILMAVAVLIVGIPAIASAEISHRYDRSNQLQVRDAIARLDNASARLQSDLGGRRDRRVLSGFLSFSSAEGRAISKVRAFRQAVRDLRARARGVAREHSVDEARTVIEQGVQLDRYWRLRTGRTSVDADLAEIRSGLHVIADAYGLSVPY
ncbi:MAG: hypothetical protein ABR607_05535 [Pyrinomonadaceae bacterium]